MRTQLLPIAPVAVPPKPAMPIGMSVIGVPAWSPVIARAIKARASEGDYNPGIGWFRAERQCRKQHRKGDQYSFHIYTVLNVERGIGLRESGAARPPRRARRAGVMECRSMRKWGHDALVAKGLEALGLRG